MKTLHLISVFPWKALCFSCPATIMIMALCTLTKVIISDACSSNSNKNNDLVISES